MGTYSLLALLLSGHLTPTEGHGVVTMFGSAAKGTVRFQGRTFAGLWEKVSQSSNIYLYIYIDMMVRIQSVIMYLPTPNDPS